jgi:hypothetical protein
MELSPSIYTIQDIQSYLPNNTNIDDITYEKILENATTIRDNYEIMLNNIRFISDKLLLVIGQLNTINNLDEFDEIKKKIISNYNLQNQVNIDNINMSARLDEYKVEDIDNLKQWNFILTVVFYIVIGLLLLSFFVFKIEFKIIYIGFFIFLLIIPYLINYTIQNILLFYENVNDSPGIRYVINMKNKVLS